ncbi:MAG: DUF4962 domain-containing protein [Fidelibacterota bacterium]|nr:MAG: DUF4962 domain-containing protein [Candidatus Neomarinimicrobiota bacterium]
MALIAVSGLLPVRLECQVDTLAWDYVVGQSWTRPARLDSLAAVHPRLLLDSLRITILQGKISSTHSYFWNIIQGKANGYLTSSPQNDPTEEEPVRSDGDAIPWLAMAYLMTGDTQYLSKAVSWMTTVCNYSTWDGNRSLGASHCLLGVALGYDWLYHAMTITQRQTIRTRLAYFAGEMAGAGPTHRERYLANHCQVGYAGLAAAGFALYGEVTGAEDWIRKAYNIFNEAYEVSGADGSSTEGHQYYGLMTEFQMHFNKMAKEILGIDFYSQNAWLRNVGNFILYSTLPDFTADKCVMRYGDTRYHHWVSHGPTYQLFNLANEYRDPHLQWLALEMAQRGIGTTDRMGWANLIWYDETLPTTPPDTLPTFRHFEDTGWITSRSSWDQDAVMIGFKCGPFHGHAVQALYDDMTTFHQIVNGHGHPDVNHFSIYAYGKWLAVDDGRSTPKHTHYHNTVLVNGIGQLGEWTAAVNSNWFDRNAVFNAGATSRILRAESDSSRDYIVGDAENIYRPGAGLTRFRRHFAFLKPDVILVLDDLAASQPSAFQWLLHTEGTTSEPGENQYRITHGDVVMDVQVLLPSAVIDNNELQQLRISPSMNAAETVILVAMHARKSGDAPATFELTTHNDSLVAVQVTRDGVSQAVTFTLIPQSEPVGIHDSNQRDEVLPGDFQLGQNYPNPFNSSTVIGYFLRRPAPIQLQVYDMAGRLKRILCHEVRTSGEHAVSWDGRDQCGCTLASGVYIYALQVDEKPLISKRSILLK